MLAPGMYYPYLEVQVCLPVPGQPVCLVDFGLADNFIDTNMAQVLSILVQPKMVLDQLETINGSCLSSRSMKQETMPLEVAIQDHQEVFQFGMIHSPYFSIL